MTDRTRPGRAPEDAVRPYLLVFDDDVLSDEEYVLLDIDRKLAAMRGVNDVGPGTGMGEFITRVEDLPNGGALVFTELKAIRETTRRFTLRVRGEQWVIERCEEPCPICHGQGRCHLCGDSDTPGHCHCCGGKGFHKDRFLFLFPVTRACSFCEGTGNCLSCEDGTCKTCRGRGWIKSPSFRGVPER